MDLEIIKIASDTKNNNVLKDCTHIAKHKNPLCGDEITIYLKLNREKIDKFNYQSKSCIYCQASVSLLSKYATNKSLINIKFLIKEIDKYFKIDEFIFPKKLNIFKKIFKKKNFSRKECLLLPFKALSKLLN